MRGRSLRSLALLWAALLALWLVMAGAFSAVELLVGGVAAAVGTVVWEAALPTADRGRDSAGSALRLWALPGRVLADAWIVAGTIARRLAGKGIDSGLRTVPFDPGEPGAQGQVRRAATVIALSITPNAYVVDVDADRGVLLLHELDRSAPAASDPRILT